MHEMENHRDHKRDSISYTDVDGSEEDNVVYLETSYSEVNTYEQKFNNKQVEINKLELIIKEKLQERDILGVEHPNQSRRNPEKNITKTFTNHPLTGDQPAKSNYKKNGWFESGNACMTDTEKIRLEQLMSDAPIEAFSGAVTSLKTEPFGGLIYDASTRKRLDEINEELKKLRTTRCLDKVTANEKSFGDECLEELCKETNKSLETTPIGEEDSGMNHSQEISDV